MDTGSIFTAIVAGIVLGVIGRLLIPGRQALGWILTFVLGLLGAFIGGFLAEGLGLDVWWHTFIVQAVVAALLVLVVSGFVGSKVRHHQSAGRTR